MNPSCRQVADVKKRSSTNIYPGAKKGVAPLYIYISEAFAKRKKIYIIYLRRSQKSYSQKLELRESIQK